MDNYRQWLKTVIYSPETDGGGPMFVPMFYNLLKDTKVNTLFEWCSGPAWIGIYLLEKGICNELVLADINDKAMDEAYETLESKGLLDKCRIYISDNLDHIDKDERFDLVVANPPNYCNIRSDHPLGQARKDISPSDLDWELHEDFYNKIGKFLNKDAKMYISEVAPYSTKVYLGHRTIPYDDRIFKPIDVFKFMIKKNGLKLNKILQRDIRHNFDVSCMLNNIFPVPLLDDNKRIISEFNILDISA